MIDPAEPLERQNERLREIAGALIRRVERTADHTGNAYTLFQAAVTLEHEVRARTSALQGAMEELDRVNARLAAAHAEAERAGAALTAAIETIQEGFALFDASDRLVLANGRFRSLLPDVAAEIRPGLAFADYARLASRSRSLALKGQTRDDWLAMRLAAHAERQALFVTRLRGDRWIQVSERHTRDGDSAILQTDVTDMVRMERQEREKLLDDQARLVRATLDHLRQGVCVFDARLRLAGWNDRMAELLGLPMRLVRSGVGFDSIANFLTGAGRFADPAAARPLMAWIRGAPGRRPLAIELTRSDGAILDIHCREMPDRGAVVSITDVTAERRAAAALHEANETLEQRVAARTGELQAARDQAERANLSKTRFLAAASHDLLQPLNAVKLFIASLRETRLDPEQAEIAERVQSAFASTEALLGALLDISKLESDGLTAQIVRFPIARILDPVRQEFAALADRKGLRLSVAPSSAWVESDPHYLRRVVQNLVSNAVRYTREGRVLVGCRRRGASLRIEVRDTGPGIDPASIPDIFREFHRLPAQDAATERGMGLGLAIADRACRLLRHPLGVESEPGRGATFWVSAPLAAAGDAARAGAPEPPAHAGGLDGLVALVIEDEDDVRGAMVSLLETWRAGVLEAATAEDALDLMEQLDVAPDVILADYHLNGGADGLALVRELRRRHGRRIPAVLVTADRGAALAREAARDDIPILNKPVQPHRLRAMLNWLRTA